MRNFSATLQVLPVDMTTRHGTSDHEARAVCFNLLSRMDARQSGNHERGGAGSATPAPAQDAGVSGIPPGPANARGLNGSVSDPSGSGNAAKAPAIQPPIISPVPVPTLSAPAATYRAFPVQRTVRMRPARFAASRSRRSAARAAVTERDRLLDHKLTSICRGC
jgi:hypothetical protein